MSFESLVLEKTTLPSGLSLVIAPLPHAHRVVLYAALRSGPAYEAPGENGVSHFLEHMLYRGTPSHPNAHDQADAFESLGGSLVATTYVDHGSMAIGLPRSSLEAVLPLFGQAFLSPVFDGIEIEKSIVKEEILEGLDDDGNEVDADELIRALCFGGHPLGNPIVGTIARLERFDRSLLERYHRAFYQGASSVLVIAGPVEPARVVPGVERAFAALPRGGAPVTPPLELPAGPRFRYVRHATSQTDLRVGFRAPAELDPLEPAMDVLLRVIDDGMSSRLYHRLCDQRGLCYDVSAGYEAYVPGGIFDLAAESTHERTPAVLGELLELVCELRDTGPSDAEIDKIKARLRWNFESMLDDPAELAAFVATSELGKVAESPKARLEQLLSATRDDVRRSAEQVFRPEGLSVVAVGSLKKRQRDRMEKAVLGFR